MDRRTHQNCSSCSNQDHVVLLTSMESGFRSLHIWKRRQILDCNIPRQKRLREWVTRQRSRSFSRKLWETDYGSTEETHVRQSTSHTRSQCDPSEDCIPIVERNWIDITVNGYCKKYTKSTSRNWSLKWHVIWTSKNENLTEQFIGNRWVRSYDVRSWKMEKIPSLDFDWIIHIWKGSSKSRFQYCKNSCDDLLYVRAIQGHTEGEVIACELMDHVAIPIEWKEFLFQRGYSINTNLTYGTHRYGKESKEGRQTVFFTPLDPWRDETEEEFDSDLFKSRTVHYQSKLKYSQDVVYWIHVDKA